MSQKKQGRASFVDRLKEYERRFAWSLSGFVLAAVFGAISVYLGFFKEVSPDLNFVVTSNSSVLDIKENLGDLDVMYEGNSLKSSGKDLRIITFEVVNQGNDAILSNYYDPKDPVGFEVVGGTIADDPTVISASNDYLRENLLIRRDGGNEAFFSDVILEPGELYQIKVLVLHDINDDPYVQPVGKVANVSKLEVFTGYDDSSDRSFLEVAYGGGLLANLSRFVVYGFLFLVSLFLVISVGGALEDIASKRDRRRRVEVFKSYNNEKVVLADDVYFSDYIKSGHFSCVTAMYNLLNDSDYLGAVKGLVDEMDVSGDVDHEKFAKILKHPSDYSAFKQLEESGLISLNGGDVTVSQERKEVFVEFVSFLRKRDFRINNHFLNHDRVRFSVNSSDLAGDSFG